VLKAGENQMAEFITKSKVKEALKSKGLSTSEEAIEALDKQVKRIIERIAERAKLSGMKTAKARHV